MQAFDHIFRAFDHILVMMISQTIQEFSHWQRDTHSQTHTSENNTIFAIVLLCGCHVAGCLPTATLLCSSSSYTGCFSNFIQHFSSFRSIPQYLHTLPGDYSPSFLTRLIIDLAKSWPASDMLPLVLFCVVTSRTRLAVSVYFNILRCIATAFVQLPFIHISQVKVEHN